MLIICSNPTLQALFILLYEFIKDNAEPNNYLNDLLIHLYFSPNISRQQKLIEKRN